MTEYNRLAEQYKSFKESPFCRYAEEYTYFKVIGNLEGKSVLDLACGEGHYSRKIKRKGAAQLVGLDVSDGMIELARKQEEQEPLGIKYQVGDGSNLGRIGLFDMVTASYLLNYAPNAKTLLAMCMTVYDNLKPDGRFITLIPNGDVPSQYYSPEFDKLKKYYFYFLCSSPLEDETPVELHFCKDEDFSVIMYHYAWETYKKTLEDAGFKDVRSHNFSVAPEGVETMGSDFWNDFLEIAPLLCVECKK